MATFTRRNIIRTGLAAPLGLVAASGCDLLSTSADTSNHPDESGKTPRTGGSASLPTSNEAPSLMELADEGKIPQLEDRLPENPVVLQPVEGRGNYGDVYHNLWGDYATLLRQVGNECLLRWKPQMRNFSSDELIPNLAHDYHVSDNAKEYSFTLRKGVKWSDGKPFTADDITFWWDDIVSNDELTPVKPGWLTLHGKLGIVTSPDPQTVIFTFPQPYRSFLLFLAGHNGVDMCNAPAHYLKQFHIKYNKDADADAKRAGYDSWTDLFGQHYWWGNGGRKDGPTLNAWIVRKPYGGGGNNVELERNPYYWKVDPGGNQLPYMDRVWFATIDNPDARQLKAANGDFDVYFGAADNSGPPFSVKPVLARNRKKGNYHFVDLVPSFSNNAVLLLNLSCKDDVKRQVFQNRDFRIGLSYAINRQEVINAVYQRQGKPYQDAPRPESRYYDEGFAQQYIEFDKDRANQHLDKVLPDKNSKGMRLGPDGNKFSFATLNVPSRGDQWSGVLDLMKPYFEAVGVDMSLQTMSLDLALTRRQNNQYEAQIRKTGHGLDVTMGFGFTPQCAGWGTWFQEEDLGVKHTELAVEPMDAMKEQREKFHQFKTAYDPKKRDQFLREYLDVAKKQFWSIGVQLVPVGFGAVRNDFHNVPKEMLVSWNYPNPAPTNPCQYCRIS